MLQQIQSFWEGLDGRRKIIAVLSAVAIFAAIVGISRVATQPQMVLLYSGLDAAAAGEVVAALEQRGAAYEVRDAAIFVDEGERDALRMSLATDGLPASGGAGYELLDTLSGFGTTSQMFDAAYWRAKEGELARTITASPNVRAARVHIAAPVNQPFSRGATGSASVTVTMARGSLDANQAKAIRYLVSSAVAGLAPVNVAVVDSVAGVVLAGDEENGPGGGLSGDARAETLRANVQRLLEARVGAGRAIVEVNVDTAMESETVTERTLDPDSRVPISSDVESSTESATGPAPGVTVASNLPDGDVNGQGGGESSRNSSSNRERQNYDVSETKRERIIQPGQIRRVSVAVMVDGIATPDAQGQVQWQPRPQEELDRLKTLVQSAVGFDEGRGDTVTIESLQFSALPEQGSLAEKVSWLEQNGARLAQIGVLALIVLALIIFVLRPMLAPKPAPALAELTGQPDFAFDAQGARLLGEGSADDEAGAPGELLDMAPNTLSKIDRLKEVISGRTDESAAILRSWIEAPELRKEPAKS